MHFDNRLIKLQENAISSSSSATSAPCYGVILSVVIWPVSRQEVIPNPTVGTPSASKSPSARSQRAGWMNEGGGCHHYQVLQVKTELVLMGGWVLLIVSLLSITNSTHPPTIKNLLPTRTGNGCHRGVEQVWLVGEGRMPEGFERAL